MVKKLLFIALIFTLLVNQSVFSNLMKEALAPTSFSMKTLFKLEKSQLETIVKNGKYTLLSSGLTADVYIDESKSFVLKVPKNYPSSNSFLYYAIFSSRTLYKFIDWINKRESQPLFRNIKKSLLKILALISGSSRSEPSSQNELFWKGYELGTQKITLTVLKTKVLNIAPHSIGLSSQENESTQSLVLQEKFDPDSLVVERLKKYLQEGDLEKVRGCIQGVFAYQEDLLLNCGLCDLDRGVNIFKNYLQLRDDQFASFDWGEISDDLHTIKSFLSKKLQEIEVELFAIKLKKRRLFLRGFSKIRLYITRLINKSDIAETMHQIGGYFPKEVSDSVEEIFLEEMKKTYQKLYFYVTKKIIRSRFQNLKKESISPDHLDQLLAYEPSLISAIENIEQQVVQGKINPFISNIGRKKFLFPFSNIRAGLFSGSFDPMTMGHLLLMLNHLSEGSSDFVAMMPNKENSKHKPDKNDFEWRFELIKKVLVDFEPMIQLSKSGKKLSFPMDIMHFIFKERGSLQEVSQILGGDLFLTWFMSPKKSYIHSLISKVYNYLGGRHFNFKFNLVVRPGFETNEVIIDKIREKLKVPISVSTLPKNTSSSAFRDGLEFNIYPSVIDDLFQPANDHIYPKKSNFMAENSVQSSA